MNKKERIPSFHLLLAGERGAEEGPSGQNRAGAVLQDVHRGTVPGIPSFPCSRDPEGPPGVCGAPNQDAGRRVSFTTLVCNFSLPSFVVITRF